MITSQLQCFVPSRILHILNYRIQKGIAPALLHLDHALRLLLLPTSHQLRYFQDSFFKSLKLNHNPQSHVIILLASGNSDIHQVLSPSSPKTKVNERGSTAAGFHSWGDTSYCLYDNKCDNLTYAFYYTAPNKITSCQMGRIRSLGQKEMQGAKRNTWYLSISWAATITEWQSRLLSFNEGTVRNSSSGNILWDTRLERNYSTCTLPKSSCCFVKIHYTAATQLRCHLTHCRKMVVQRFFLWRISIKKTACAILPRPVFTVVGLNAFHTIVSQILVAMKSEMPEPRPYPFCRSSSKSRTINPATKSYSKKRNTTLVPSLLNFY